MLNQVVLVGRIIDIKEDVGTIITVAVSRTYKNNKGEYEKDLIDCSLYGSIENHVKEYCKIGDIIGIKGKLRNLEDKLEFIGEKVSYLSNGGNKDE
jgi:single-stranded DNA-binding protein